MALFETGWLFGRPKEVRDLRNSEVRYDSGRSMVGLLVPVLLYGLFLFSGCERMLTSPGPQPKVLNPIDFSPMLNVFGVLRPDSLQGFPLSFVHVERSWPYPSYEDSVEISDAEVQIIAYEQGVATDTFRLIYTDFDSIFPDPEYRHSDLFAQAGRRYSLVCRRDGYPEVKGETIVPDVPQLIRGGPKVEGDALVFTIKRDSLTALYDVYLLLGAEKSVARIPRPDYGDIEVRLSLQRPLACPALLIVYAYDLHLSEYISFNVNFKPHTFRGNYSTVEGGFGCFGSLNMLVLPLGSEGERWVQNALSLRLTWADYLHFEGDGRRLQGGDNFF